MKIFLIGFMGSGKSTIGKYVAKHTLLSHIDLDEYITHKAEMTIPQIFKMGGESYFRKIERHALEEICEKEDSLIISCGGGTPCFFDNMTLINQVGKSIFLDLSAGRLADRLRKSKTARPLLTKVKGDLQIYVHHKLMERAVYYAQAHYTLLQDKARKKEVLCIVEHLLREESS